tara:strand:+ start:389 stop:646 length:258 start_codon:yes stop_codon:yes gene_type:complete
MTWMAWMIAGVVGVLSFFGTRMYDRVTLEKAVHKIGGLEAEKEALMEKCLSLEENLHAAKRAPMDHAAVGKRLRELAEGAVRGVV